ncbi:hypothetical protein [Chondrinema litorale]|uniref:hypothetical protein n=1 Tax=Chondrinema litorale TaxID=2994555 RepID=UPI003D6F64B5
MDERAFASLTEFLGKVPAVQQPIATGSEEGMWWVKFSINIEHPLAWNVVQEFGHIMNYLSIDERLPTVFYPVSPPPYMNGGPTDFLSWIIETTDKEFKPGTLKKWLEGRLPNPVENEDDWNTE